MPPNYPAKKQVKVGRLLLQEIIKRTTGGKPDVVFGNQYLRESAGPCPRDDLLMRFANAALRAFRVAYPVPDTKLGNLLSL